MSAPRHSLTPIGVVYTMRNREGEHNMILVYGRPYGFKVLEGPGVSENDPLIDVLHSNALKNEVEESIGSAVAS